MNFFLRFLLSILPITGIYSADQILILNMMNGIKTVPLHFRTMKDSFRILTPIIPTTYGLGDIRASGSAQFSEDALEMILSTLQEDQVMVLDLREESHGFLNGNAISWFAPRDWGNRGKTLNQILKEEGNLLQGLLQVPTVTVIKVLSKNPNGEIGSSEKMNMKVNKVQGEAELVKKSKLDYLRIPVTDHLPPSDAAVEKFLTLIRTLDKKTWLHIHCAAGDGRTTTFLAMLDMYNNALNVTFDDIISRQWRLGGINLSSMPPEGDWKYPGIKDRIMLLRQFYEFCYQGKAQTNGNWTQWRSEKGYLPKQG